MEQRRPNETLPDQIPQWAFPQQPRVRRRFRWSLVLVPAAVLLTLWILMSIKLGFSWGDVMSALNVKATGRYTNLMLLGLVCVGVAAVIRVLRGRRDDDES